MGYTLYCKEAKAFADDAVAYVYGDDKPVSDKRKVGAINTYWCGCFDSYLKLKGCSNEQAFEKVCV